MFTLKVPELKFTVIAIKPMFVNWVLILNGAVVGACLSIQEKSLRQAKNHTPRIQLYKIKVSYYKLKYIDHAFMKEKRNLEFKKMQRSYSDLRACYFVRKFLI